MLKFAFLSFAAFLFERHSRFLSAFLQCVRLYQKHTNAQNILFINMSFAFENVTKQL